MPKSRKRKKTVLKQKIELRERMSYGRYSKRKKMNYFKTESDSKVSYYNGKTHAWIRFATEEEELKFSKGEL